MKRISRKRSSKRIQKVTCSSCGKNYETKGRRKCSDGLLRCRTCRNKRQRRSFVEKHGVSQYEKYQKENPHYRKRTREWVLKSRYRLDPAEYESLLKNQGDVCAICRGKQFIGHSFCVDHNHETGEVRGLLCHKCNRALGAFQESTEVVERALHYLRG